MKSSKIKSYCKINLSLRVLKKLKNGYHNIKSLVTFCDLYDVILISKTTSSKDKITFSGKFKKGISRKRNTITKLLSLLRKLGFFKKLSFKINIKKNIPHGSGLGGGSSNAGVLLNYLNFKMKLNLNKNKIKNLAKKVGFDVPLSLERKNVLLTGKKHDLHRIKKKFMFNILIFYTNITCSTKKIYFKNKAYSLNKSYPDFGNINNKNLINFLKKEQNDLEKTVVKIYPNIKKVIKYIKLQKGCYFSRISGSGSACFGIFSYMKHATNAQKMIKLKYPNYWSAVSRTI